MQKADFYKTITGHFWRSAVKFKIGIEYLGTARRILREETEKMSYKQLLSDYLDGTCFNAYTYFGAHPETRDQVAGRFLSVWGFICQEPRWIS